VGPLIDLVPLPYTDAVVAVGAAILGLAAGVLGTFAVLRRRSLVGDAIAHSTLPGVCFAFLLTGAKDAGSLIAGAAAAGLLAAVLVVGLERAPRVRADAAIGVVLSAMFSLGVVLLTAIASGADADQAGLERYLFGQAAGLLERDLVVMLALTLAALAVVVAGHRVLRATLFDPAHAASLGVPVRAVDVLVTALLVVAVVVGVRAVGAILMVAMLVVPAVTARQLAGRLWQVLVLAGAVGVGVGVLGALLSVRWGLPTGPVVVLVGVAAATLAVLLAPGRGIAWRAARLRRDRRRAASEGVLVDLETAMHAGPPPTARELELAGGRPRGVLRRALRALDRAGLLARDDDRLRLTEAGAAAAHAALERRALWGAWLEHGWRLSLPDAREPDPSDLRGSLGDGPVDELLRLAR
jgi:manganese/zinc/iron transport system permease protein